MLRRLLDRTLDQFHKRPRLRRFRRMVTAVDSFLYEVPNTTSQAPHVRDSTDLKRWMILVVLALIPCTLMAIWNTGVQKVVYGSQDAQLLAAYYTASDTFSGYFSFCFSEGRWLSFIGWGLAAFLPVVVLSYVVGGFWEWLFATIRGHEISEGFLVTGILFALILPSTIPYWMVVVGISFGVVVGKELFGGTGMNILNPALTARIFLFFAFPAQMTGEIWVGTNPVTIERSLNQMNAQLDPIDGYTQASPLGKLHISTAIKRVQVDAIAAPHVGLRKVATGRFLEQRFGQWEKEGALHEKKREKSKTVQAEAPLPSSLTGANEDQMMAFVTGAIAQGGLGLKHDDYLAAVRFSHLRYGLGTDSDGNLFFGNRIGSMGETSILFCLIGAFVLIYMGIGSWRTMLAVAIGALITASAFQYAATKFGPDGGAWNPALFAMPAYKHLLMGSLMFGLVFMATEPVSSPSTHSGKWIYGLLIGLVVILIRLINPAYPEGVMLAILFGNVFAPLIDHYALKRYRRRYRAIG